MRLLVFSLLILGSYLQSCSPNNVKVDNSLKKYFEENKVSGTFGLFDNGQGKFTIYNLSRFTDSAYLPASTFKIVNSLIGIETGVVKNDSALIKWDGITRGRPECEKDLIMTDAFRISCVPWYQQLARLIGEKNMQHYLDTVGYAAKKGRFMIKNNLDSFWLNNDAKVTADEQLGLVKKLYFDQLPFQKRTQQLVRKMMLMENNSNYKLSYKTGLGTAPNDHLIGWIIGWIEENQHPYFFVLQVETADKSADIRSIRMNLLNRCLKQLGFMEGKK